MLYGSIDDEEYRIDMEAIDAAAQRLFTFLDQAPPRRDRIERVIAETERDIARETAQATGVYAPLVSPAPWRSEPGGSK